jgi:transcriptional/translational regulatory protein YebC/TACO1
VQQGGSAERIFNRALRRAVEAASQRLPPRKVDRAIAQAAAIDRAIKGIDLGEPWQAFLRLGLNLAGGSEA